MSLITKACDPSLTTETDEEDFHCVSSFVRVPENVNVTGKPAHEFQLSVNGVPIVTAIGIFGAPVEGMIYPLVIAVPQDVAVVKPSLLETSITKDSWAIIFPLESYAFRFAIEPSSTIGEN